MIINNIDMSELKAERYWTHPKSYKGDKKTEIKEMFLSEQYLASIKQDGHYARFIKDGKGNMKIQGRTESVNGGYLNKYDWIPQCHSFFDKLPNGTCLIGELYFPDKRGSRFVTTILGCLSNKAIERQNKEEKLHFYIFDIYAWDNKILLNVPYEKRVKAINKYVVPAAQDEQYIEIAEFFSGQAAWNKLGEVLSNGQEGMVLYSKNGIVEPGKRTARKTLKVKMEIEQTIDAFIDGNYKSPVIEYTGKSPETWEYWENIKTNEKVKMNKYFEYTNGGTWRPITKYYYNNWAGAISISVMKNGKPFHIGYISGIPDSMRKGIVETPENYKNKVFEITCMEIEKINGQYSLRHAKIVQERPDKTPMDCDFSQIE